MFARGPFATVQRVAKTAFLSADGARPAYRVLFTPQLDEASDVVVDAGTGAVLYRQSLVAHDAEGEVYENFPGAPQGGTQVTKSFGPTAESPGGYTDPTGMAGLGGEVEWRAEMRRAVLAGDGDVLQMRLSEKLLLHRGIREDHGVVLVLPGGRLSLCAQDADNRYRDFVNANDLPNRIGAAVKQGIADGCPQESDFGDASVIRANFSDISLAARALE